MLSTEAGKNYRGEEETHRFTLAASVKLTTYFFSTVTRYRRKPSLSVVRSLSKNKTKITRIAVVKKGDKQDHELR